MKVFAFLTVILLGLGTLISIHPATAKISSKNVPTLRELPIKLQESLLQEFVANYDDIRTWIIKDIIEPITTPSSIKPKSVTCNLCRIALGIVMAAVRTEEIPIVIVKDALKAICGIVLYDVVGYEVCNGAVDIYTEPLQFIVTERENLTALDLCGIYTGVEGGCPPISEDLTNWEILLDSNKPVVEDLPYLPDDIETVKILHLTDIHPDLHYAVGSDNDCGNPLCCRSTNAPPINSTYEAGYYGDYLCDQPEYSVIELFQNAASRYEYEFVLMTGDLVHHSIWETNVQDNLDHFNAVNVPLLEIFPNTPIYPVIGNHEPHPCNMFPPAEVWDINPEFNISWVYNTMANAYSKWLPVEAQQSLRRAGYYTLRTPGTSGLRLIAINTNFCYSNNFWVFYNTVDPEGQLQWLADTLQAAEEAGEYVYIAGHIPPGKSDCWTIWSNKFNAIIIRYENIIKAQFYGHTHNDETTIFFDNSVEPPRPANLYNIGVSTTAYTHLNPGYKVFYANGVVEPRTWEIVDHETWVYNLTEANSAGSAVPPNWYKLYNMKEAFGLRSLRPADLYTLVERMVNDDELFQKYWRFYYKDSTVAEECNTTTCKMFWLCEIVKADSSDYSNCDRLNELLPPPTTTPTPAPTTCSPIY